MQTTCYSKERKVAELAVERAGLLTKRIQKSHVLGTFTKSDYSPVTIADLGAQALVIAAISQAFPNDAIVAEEDSQLLHESESRRELLWSQVLAVLKETENGDLTPHVIGTIKDENEMMDLIDRGDHEGGKVQPYRGNGWFETTLHESSDSTKRPGVWVLDPVDGTKGFLRGGQYAICLALMVDGQVVVGAINCPNLYIDPKNPEAGRGVMFSSERGEGSTVRPSYPDKRSEATRISMNPITSPAEASFCEGVEAGHSLHDKQACVAAKLGITRPPVRMDSQAKYVSVARGDGDIYLRLPTSETYEEKIWDHAAGSLIVEESGGKVSDMHGKPLDFSLGRTLKENRGVIVARENVHAKVIEAISEVVVKP